MSGSIEDIEVLDLLADCRFLYDSVLLVLYSVKLLTFQMLTMVPFLFSTTSAIHSTTGNTHTKGAKIWTPQVESNAGNEKEFRSQANVVFCCEQ
jgi:hypothetical protein